MFKKKKRMTFFCFITIATILIIWIAWSNNALELNTYRIESEKLPKSFNNFRIAQVSDLHNAEMGKDNEKLISMLKEARPNIIVITGDLIDSKRTKIDVALRFAQKAIKIAPCYYICGNHEANSNEYTKLKEGLIELGVTILEDCNMEIELQGETITLVGVNDPSFKTDPLFDDTTVMNTKLKELINKEFGYTVLLSHRPELFETYVENYVDLVLCGHSHGGQFRIPLVGGIVAPNQGFFPKYDAGMYTEGNTSMVVSRGIGNSIIPFRVNNRPEVVLIELAIKEG